MLIQSLGQENPPEKERATHSSILAWKIPQTEELGGGGVAYSPWGRKPSDTTERAHTRNNVPIQGLLLRYSTAHATPHT